MTIRMVHHLLVSRLSSSSFFSFRVVIAFSIKKNDINSKCISERYIT